jgi:hypothetical protein
MRCTRCDQPTVPQAVAETADGVLVFGWCVTCLTQASCRRIVVAGRSRRPTTRLTLDGPSFFSPRRPSARRADVPPAPFDPRGPSRLLMASVSLILALWGLILLAGGVVVWALAEPRPAGGLGNGTPSLLIGGGGATVAVGLLLWLLNARLTPRQVRSGLLGVHAFGVVLALCVLLARVVYPSPKYKVLILGLLCAAVVLSTAARWVAEIRYGPAVTNPE